jgi:hypothetical protein
MPGAVGRPGAAKGLSTVEEASDRRGLAAAGGELMAGGGLLNIEIASGFEGRSGGPDCDNSAPCWEIRMTREHLRHFIRTERSATFSSAIWYLALQLGQMNFIQCGRGFSVKLKGVGLSDASYSSVKSLIGD